MAETSEMPNVEVFMARPAFQLGGVVVGTVLIRPSSDHPTASSLRDVLKSVVVYASGYCRIDPRWHNVADYTKIYGASHPCVQLLSMDYDAELLTTSAPEETVCFWATYGMELLELPERTLGAVWSDSEMPELLAYTFRVDLPLDLPHSLNANSCRYYYTANVLIKTAHTQRIIKTPFEVWANPSQPLGIPRSVQNQQRKQGNGKKQAVVIPGARVKFGICLGLAHSSGYPSALSATEIHRPKGPISVALPSRPDVQTLRVSNARGQPVCVMTVVGATQLTPGSRIHLQWDFPERLSTNKAWIPCHQVAACIGGEELALYEDGHTTRTQTFVWDACHEWVDPGVTHRVSKTLILPADAPCNLYTDIMELYVRCQVDITVKENGEYNNLHIELPCHVVQKLPDPEMFDEETKILPLSELLNEKPPKDSFAMDDIENELKILGLQMEEKLELSGTIRL
eukprot:Nitzschia sp. Nitz4//scaffold11_size288233//13775//15142//NITZ4_000727-RA/size288233-processed-gene-0.198-mRNA-1//-1//CDS//3329533933//4793//frame0